jgi:hypothetical protein
MIRWRMLIVNADDYGASERVTDAILTTMAAGAVTSASGMVFMRDTERAARLAREQGRAIGLHVNLTMAFTGEDVPDEVRERQRALTEVFTRESWRDETKVGRAARREVVRCVEDQLTEFRRHFGEPTHLDGHHHVHVHSAVLDALPGRYPVRPVITPTSMLGTRDRRQRRIHRRFVAPDGTVDFRHLHPALGGEGFAVLDAAREGTLEVMTHPQPDDERAALLSDEWRSAIADLRRGSFADLGAAARTASARA